MCGIAAILLHPQERPAEIWQAIKESLTHNLLYNQERGDAATGLAVIQTDGQVFLQKMPLSATEFVATYEYEALLNRIGPQTTLLLGHTRHPTKGTPANNDNNHPLQVGAVLGVHNGHIHNDDNLFSYSGYPRQAEVDSEIIFRLLEPISPLLPNHDYLTKIRDQLQWLQGKYTFLACDRRTPARLLVIKHHNPLSIHFQAEWNALIFSSRYVFLRKTFGRAVLHEVLPRNQLLLFDAYTLPKPTEE